VIRGFPSDPLPWWYQALLVFPYFLTACSIPEPAAARSCGVMAGVMVSLALKARNHGSAMEGICEVSFLSKMTKPQRSPNSLAMK
jgi:hypothetical protein